TLADLVPGPHTLTVQGFDQAGNAVETTVLIIYDATPPTTSWTTGRDNFVNVTAPVLTGAVSDSYGVSEVISSSLDGASPVQFTLTRSPDLTEGLFAIPTSGLSEGPHTLQITATDRVGNATTQTFSVVVDLTAPALVLDPIAHQGYLSRS